MIEMCVDQAFEMLETIATETKLLASADARSSQSYHGKNESSERIVFNNGNEPHIHGYGRRRLENDPSVRLDGSSSVAGMANRALLSASGKPLQPFTLVNDRRSQIRDQVFRPDHNLPTMTIDEYLEAERQRGGIIDDVGPSSGTTSKVDDEDNMNLADAATMKAREWDEYKEAHPRGSGNTINRG